MIETLPLIHITQHYKSAHDISVFRSWISTPTTRNFFNLLHNRAFDNTPFRTLARWMRRGGTRGGENTTATWTARWHRHIEWQRQLLVNLAAGKTPPRAPRFLVLRPGDKLTVCNASGMHDLRGQCYRGTPPSRRRPLDGEHWDAFMTSGNAKLMRPLPGLGNVALSCIRCHHGRGIAPCFTARELFGTVAKFRLAHARFDPRE